MGWIAFLTLVGLLAAQGTQGIYTTGRALPQGRTRSTDRDVRLGYGREFADRCTSIGVGPKAMADGSTVTTHNNDCQECDLRVTHVPSRDWPAGSMRPVYGIRNAYPRYVETAEENIHGPDYLLENVDTSIYNWSVSKPIGYIEQVSYTYAYTLGAYALQNEKQVSMGESTCSSKFIAAPVGTPGGKALMHMETLTEIALERCDSARCAIQTMGDLAVKYGFYGGEYDGELEFAQDEAGEAMTVSDPKETWMFHVLPDDTGSSAIWVAQRVPDDHITAVANQFVIAELDLANTKDFMASANVEEVAQRNHFWQPSDGKLNFARVYGNDRHATAFACTRRVWRVFTLAVPSLGPVLSGYTDGLATFGFGPNLTQPYPFSVRVEKPLTVQDIMNINRDQYEGSDFDMTKGTDAGPFGDPMRYAPAGKAHDPEEGLTAEQFNSGLQVRRVIPLPFSARVVHMPTLTLSSIFRSTSTVPSPHLAVAHSLQQHHTGPRPPARRHRRRDVGGPIRPPPRELCARVRLAAQNPPLSQHWHAVQARQGVQLLDSLPHGQLPVPLVHPHHWLGATVSETAGSLRLRSPGRGRGRGRQAAAQVRPGGRGKPGTVSRAHGEDPPRRMVGLLLPHGQHLQGHVRGGHAARGELCPGL